MRKKHFKKQIRDLQGIIVVLEKKCALLEIILKWQSQRLEGQREMRIKQEKCKRL